MGDKQQTVRGLLNKNLDELYVELGRELYGGAAFPSPLGQLGQVARVWLQTKRVEIARVVCPNATVRMLLSDEISTQDRLILVTAVADLIASVIIEVSPVTVGVLLVKEGLKALCETKGLL